MSDSFDEYFDTNREPLDAEAPMTEMVWEGIQAELLHQHYRHRLRRWQIAASIAALIAIGAAGWNFSTLKPAQAAVIEVATMSPIAQLESNYQAQVEALNKEVNARISDRSRYEVYFNELKSIEATEQEFQDDIPVVNDRQRLTMILVDTYEKKIRLLERMLLELEREERENTRQNSTEQTLETL